MVINHLRVKLIGNCFGCLWVNLTKVCVNQEGQKNYSSLTVFSLKFSPMRHSEGVGLPLYMILMWFLLLWWPWSPGCGFITLEVSVLFGPNRLLQHKTLNGAGLNSMPYSFSTTKYVHQLIVELFFFFLFVFNFSLSGCKLTGLLVDSSVLTRASSTSHHIKHTEAGGSKKRDEMRSSTWSFDGDVCMWRSVLRSCCKYGTSSEKEALVRALWALGPEWIGWGTEAVVFLYLIPILFCPLTIIVWM